MPSVDLVLSQAPIVELVHAYSHIAVVEQIRQQLDETRGLIANGGTPPTLAEVVDTVRERISKSWRTWPHRVINATGVILHTNLGRAPLSSQAVGAVASAAQGYTNLEFDLDKGRRGSRQASVDSLLCQLTGAQSAFVVNNNASAVMIALAALASGKEVVVSRAEAVEIGGGFRIPEVLAQSGATLVEVGTTNRTYVTDYEAAITEATAALLTVHASNFRVLGFTHRPAIGELVDLGRKYNVPVLNDLGSGCLIETEQFGLAHEPMPQESVAAGCGLSMFSGDKLLGGPQAGIIVGQQALMDRLLTHPLARAVRIDKLSLAALSATLLHYLTGEVDNAIPVWRMIASSPQELRRRASRWQRVLGSKASLVKGESTIGGGSLPGETLPTWLIAIESDALLGGAEGLTNRLRQAEPPVVARIEAERVLLDPRTVLPEEEAGLLYALREAIGEATSP